MGLKGDDGVKGMMGLKGSWGLEKRVIKLMRLSRKEGDGGGGAEG